MTDASVAGVSSGGFERDFGPAPTVAICWIAAEVDAASGVLAAPLISRMKPLCYLAAAIVGLASGVAGCATVQPLDLPTRSNLSHD